jgi:membrane-associated phospholipid phosphatase
MIARTRLPIGILTVALLVVAVRASAQETPAPRLVIPKNLFEISFQQRPAGPPPTPAHTGIRATLKAIPGDFLHIPSKWNAIWAGIGGGLALAVHPKDDDINVHLTGKPWVHRVFVTGKYLGAYALVGATGTIYAYGRITGRPRISHVGMDLVRALVVDEVLTQVIKRTVRRERPDGSDHKSFPSGHASSTFAFATALERHLSWRYAVPAYVFASYVASSRMHENRHFASDVIFGAAVGIISGRTVTRHGRDMFSLNVVPLSRGAAVLFTR